MMFSGRTPHALLIEDDPLDAQIEQITLEQAGFVVVSARSLLEGETCAMQMLSLDAKAMPASAKPLSGT